MSINVFGSTSGGTEHKFYTILYVQKPNLRISNIEVILMKTSTRKINSKFEKCLVP